MTDPRDPYRPADPYRQSDPYQASDPYQSPEAYQNPGAYHSPDVYQSPEPPTAAQPPAAPSPPFAPMSGTPATAPLPVPYGPPAAGYAGYGAAVSGAGAYGYDPLTGQPYSDKSKVVAGLLQLLLGFTLTLGGVGRLYAGNTGLGVAQIVASLIGWISFWCGLFLFFTTWIVWGGVWLWFVIDGIVMLAGRPVDGQGRPLRA